MEISKELLEHAYKGGFIECKHIHANSCNKNSLIKFITVFKSAIKFYMPIHLIPVLLFKRKALSE